MALTEIIGMGAPIVMMLFLIIHILSLKERFRGPNEISAWAPVQEKLALEEVNDAELSEYPCLVGTHRGGPLKVWISLETSHLSRNAEGRAFTNVELRTGEIRSNGILRRRGTYAAMIRAFHLGDRGFSLLKAVGDEDQALPASGALRQRFEYAGQISPALKEVLERDEMTTHLMELLDNFSELHIEPGRIRCQTLGIETNQARLTTMIERLVDLGQLIEEAQKPDHQTRLDFQSAPTSLSFKSSAPIEAEAVVTAQR